MKNGENTLKLLLSEYNVSTNISLQVNIKTNKIYGVGFTIMKHLTNIYKKKLKEHGRNNALTLAATNKELY